MVAVSRGRTDLPQRDAFETALREEALRGQDDLLLGGGRNQGHHAMEALWTPRVK